MKIWKQSRTAPISRAADPALGIVAAVPFPDGGRIAAAASDGAPIPPALPQFALVLNKIDRLPGHAASDENEAEAEHHSHSDLLGNGQRTDKSWYDIIRHKHRDSIGVSARTGEGLQELRQAVIRAALDSLRRNFAGGIA